jgi:hypothetical protein
MKNNYRIVIFFIACFLGNIPLLTAQCLVSVDAGEDLYMCTGRNVKLDGTLTGTYISYQWSPWLPLNKIHEFNPIIPIPQTITYTLTARSYDPSQNMIQNPDFEQGNLGFATDLTYSPGNIVPPGTYDVLTNPQAANNILDPCGDHPSGGGNMLAINPAPQNVGQDVWQQTIAVTPNTQYYFFFWSTMAQFGTQSTLALFINGIQVATMTPPISSPCNWSERKGVWFSDIHSTADIAIRVAFAGAPIALDNFYFGPVCEVSDDVTFFVGQPQAVAAPASYLIPCSGFEQTLSGAGSSVGPQFEYLWETGDGNIVSGANTLNPVVNSPGTYTLTVSMPAALGGDCPKTTTVHVAEAQPQLSTWITTVQALTCNNNTVVLNGQFNQPAGGLSFQWMAGPGGNIVSGSNSASTAVNQPGEYTLVVTNTTTGCTAESSFTVNAPVPPTASIQPPPILQSPNDTLTLSATITPANGIVSWSTPNGNIVGGANTLNPQVTAPGWYILTVTNMATGCTATASTIVSAAAVCPVSVQAGEDVLLCEAGTVSLQGTVTGPLLDLVWWPEAGLSDPATLSPTATVSQTTAFVLTARSYDSGLNLLINPDFENGNTGITSDLTYSAGDLIQPRHYAVLANPNAGNPAFPICSDHTSGSGMMLASSPSDTSAHLNLWCQSIPVVPGTEYLFEGFVLLLQGAGDITFIANNDTLGYFSVPADTCSWGKFSNIWSSGIQTTAALCVGTDDSDLAFALDDLFFTPMCAARDTVVVQVADSPVVAVANAPDALTCVAIAVALDADGSSQGLAFSYAWSTTDGHIESGANTPAPTVSAPGTYALVVTNTDNGCTASAETTMQQDISAPEIAVLPTQSLTCVLATQTLQGQNASPAGNFSYEWTAATGGNIVAGQTALQPEIDAPGTYALLATNLENGCTATAETIVQQDISAPEIAVLPAQPLTCVLTTQTLQGQNASPAGNFSYEWTAAAGGNIVSGQTALQPEIDAPGTYTLLATNLENGCTTAVETSVQQDISAPEIAVLPAQPLTCVLTTQTLQGQNASPAGNFSYQWTAAAGGNIVSGQTMLQPEIDAPGTYALLATNLENGCTATVEVDVVQYDDVVVVPTNQTDAGCFGASDGALTVAAAGGDGIFTFLWSNGATSPIAANLPAGTYSVVVTDGSGCTATTVAIVGQPDPILPNATTTPLTGPGSNDGSATASPGGGIPPYSYVWSGGSMEQTIADLMAGFYTVTVTDANGCTAEQTVEVWDAVCNLAAGVAANDPRCFGAADGSAMTTPLGGTAPFTYLWSNGDPDQTASDLIAGMYSVVVTDANGCQFTTTVTLNDPALLVLEPGAVTDASCPGTPDGSAGVLPAGGTGSISIVWSTGQQGATATNLPAGTHTATATDANGCTAEVAVIVQASDTEPPVIQGAPATVLLGPAGGISLTVQNLGVLVSDNCGVANIQIEPGSFDCLQLGQQSVTVTVTDMSGNTAEQTMAVTVADHLAPEVVCPPDVRRCYDDRTVQYPAPVATDNCLVLGGQFDLVQGLPSGAVFPEGVTITHYTFTDAGGNVGGCSFMVTVLSPLVVTLNALLDDLAGQNIGSVLVSVSGSQPGYTYEWRRDGAFFATTQDLIGVGVGAYSLIVSDSEGCTASAGPFEVDDLVGTDQPDWSRQVAVFPNPTTGLVYVVFPDEMTREMVRFTVFDATGKLVMGKKMDWKKQVELNGAMLPEGLYTLLIQTNQGQMAYRIVVNRR